MIPTKNQPALIGYYMGVIGLLPFIGIPFAVAAIILGIMGLRKYKIAPGPGAKGHAMTALILGIIEVICLISFIAIMVLAASSRPQ